jgi:predicted nuclease of restriction endonuclease-like RecB superfamily
MLSAELIRPRLKVRAGEISTRPVSANYHYLGIATDLITIFNRHVGHNRSQLAQALRDYEGASLDYPIMRGLSAVLEAHGKFGNDPPLKPAELRANLFGRGPVVHRQDLFSGPRREQVLAETAVGLALEVAEVETALFADLAEEQILLDAGDPVGPGELIARYNLELARGLLYWAREVRLHIRDNYKDVFKYIKLFKLMYTVRQSGLAGGYDITLHGPISPFVTSTIRYGLQFAKFLPALLLCENWRMEADIQPPVRSEAEVLLYRLDDRAELRSHFKSSPPFDSRLEADFAAEFEAKYQGPKRSWELAREAELIVVEDSVMIPDFALTHRRDGRRALLEIVGFWHPHYLKRKLAKVRQAKRKDLILLVYESANVAEGAFETASAGEVLKFSRKPILKDVLAAVERCAIPPAN